MNSPLGCSTLCFARMPRRDALRLIHSLGFRWVDLGMLRRFTVGESPFCALHLDALDATPEDVQAVAAELDRYDLQLATLNAGGGYLNLAWEHERAVSYARRTIDICRQLGGYAVTIQSGKLLRGTDWADNVRYVSPAFRDLAGYAAAQGIELHVEGPHVEMLTHNLQTTQQFLEIVDAENLYVTLDPSHIIVADEDPADVTRALGASIRHVHIRDGAGTSPVVVPGHGEINFPELLDSLTTIGYVRPLIIELCQDESEPYEASCARFLRDTEESRDFVTRLTALPTPRGLPR